jgi:hypothetical protein
MMNKKILVVSHQYLPLTSPRTTRWKLLTDQLISEGYEVKILTATSQLSDDKNNNAIFLGNNKTSNLIIKLRKESNKENSIIKKNLLNLLKKIYRFFFKTFAWPDYAMFWLISVYKNRNNINYEYDSIISVSLPFSSHVAAFIINKNKKKNWILDIGDPFSLKTKALENNIYIYKKLNIYIEKKFYKLASQIVFTHLEVAKQHVEKFKIDENKILIGNPISSFNENIFLQSKNYDYSSLPIIIGYFGILTKGVRSPDETIKFFKNSDILINWFTNQDSKNMLTKNNFDLSNHKFFEIIDRDEALNKMSSSMHCLLSIGNLNSLQLPSKVIEYISTGKPVIHFAEIKNDPVIKLADHFQNLIVVNKDSTISQTLEQLKNIFENINSFEKNYFLENYTAKAITKNLKIF